MELWFTSGHTPPAYHRRHFPLSAMVRRVHWSQGPDRFVAVAAASMTPAHSHAVPPGRGRFLGFGASRGVLRCSMSVIQGCVVERERVADLRRVRAARSSYRGSCHAVESRRFSDARRNGRNIVERAPHLRPPLPRRYPPIMPALGNGRTVRDRRAGCATRAPDFRLRRRATAPEPGIFRQERSPE